MGCCVSSCERKNRNHKRTSLEKNHHSSGVSKSPPTPDEELVKEVLTETPEPEPEPEIKALNCDPEPEPDKCRILGSPGKPFLVQNSTSEDDIANTVVDEVIYRVNKSQGYNSNFGTNNCNNNNNNNNNTSDQKTRLSPVRRAYPSPPRRYSGTGTGTGRVGLRRDVSGENSGRRSQSPGTRSNVGRSVSARRGGMSPGRVRMVHGPDDEIRDEWAGPRESLENPLVSLECFIFL